MHRPIPLLEGSSQCFPADDLIRCCAVSGLHWFELGHFPQVVACDPGMGSPDTSEVLAGEGPVDLPVGHAARAHARIPQTWESWGWALSILHWGQ